MIADTVEARGAFRNVWVVAEVMGGHIQKVSYELLGAARSLADARRTELWAVVLGHGVAAEAAELFHGGADVALVVDDPRFAEFIDEDQAAVLSRLIEKYKPEIVVCGATTRGRALIPRVAVFSNCGLTADCTGLDIDPDTGDLLQTRPAFGGNIMATILCQNHRPQMATVRHKVMKAAPKIAAPGGKIIEMNHITVPAPSYEVLDFVEEKSDTVNIVEADFIVSGGRGVKDPKNFALLHDLAKEIGAAVGASRAAVDSGWIPYSHQVGQTGKTVNPKIYIACGISGAIQHLAGMKSSDIIIAINADRTAPIFDVAHFGIVGDLFEVIPEIIKQVKG
jgi:electron transfer flavoprotein alpha subunit